MKCIVNHHWNVHVTEYHLNIVQIVCWRVTQILMTLTRVTVSDTWLIDIYIVKNVLVDLTFQLLAPFVLWRWNPVYWILDNLKWKINTTPPRISMKEKMAHFGFSANSSLVWWGGVVSFLIYSVQDCSNSIQWIGSSNIYYGNQDKL